MDYAGSLFRTFADKSLACRSRQTEERYMMLNMTPKTCRRRRQARCSRTTSMVTNEKQEMAVKSSGLKEGVGLVSKL